MKNKALNTHKAVYIGRRLTPTGKIRYCFELPNKEEMAFARRIKQVWIGYTYLCGKESISTKPERTNDAHVSNPKWEAQDALVDAHNAKKRADRTLQKLSKQSLAPIIDALRPIVQKLDFYEQTKLATYLVNKSGIKK